MKFILNKSKSENQKIQSVKWENMSNSNVSDNKKIIEVKYKFIIKSKDRFTRDEKSNDTNYEDIDTNCEDKHALTTIANSFRSFDNKQRERITNNGIEYIGSTFCITKTEINGENVEDVPTLKKQKSKKRKKPLKLQRHELLRTKKKKACTICGQTSHVATTHDDNLLYV